MNPTAEGSLRLCVFGARCSATTAGATGLLLKPMQDQLRVNPIFPQVFRIRENLRFRLLSDRQETNLSDAFDGR
jgi:hypothetical protein